MSNYFLAVVIPLIHQCALMVAPDTMVRLVRIESGGNPYAIGVVGGRLERQPKNIKEALVTVADLRAHGWNYSVGLAQINKKNFAAYGLTDETAFEPCANLHAGGKILQSCYARTMNAAKSKRETMQSTLSCYNSGGVTRAGLSYASRYWSAD